MAEHMDYKTKNKNTLEFNDTQGGVDPMGDSEAKKKGGNIDVKGGNAQNAKDLTKVDSMGTEAGKKGNKGMKKGDHFKVSTDVEPSGTDAGKGSYRNNVG